MVKSPLVSPVVILSFSWYPKFPWLKFRISFTHEWDFEPDRQVSFGQRGLLEVSFKGVMETSSRREFRIFRLRKGFNWNANWKNLLELFNWRLYKKSGDHGPVQPGPSKSQSELPVFFELRNLYFGFICSGQGIFWIPGLQYQVLFVAVNTLIEVPK